MEQRGNWNDALMKDCVSTAYIDILTEIKNLSLLNLPLDSKEVSLLFSRYYTVFPDMAKLIPVMSNVGKYFYDAILDIPLFWSNSSRKWVKIGEEKVYFNPSNRCFHFSFFSSYFAC